MQYILNNFIMIKICEAYSFFSYLLLGGTTRRISCTMWEQETRQRVLMEEQKDKRKISFYKNKFCTCLHLYQYLLHHKPHKKEYSRVVTQQWMQTLGQETAEDMGRMTQLSPQMGKPITIKLLSNNLRSDKYPQMCSLYGVPPMHKHQTWRTDLLSTCAWLVVSVWK